MKHSKIQPRVARCPARHNLLEGLEPRQLMSTTTVNGTTGNDTYTLTNVNPNDTIIYNGKGGGDTINIESTGRIGTILGNIQLQNVNGGTWGVEIDNLGASAKRVVTVDYGFGTPVLLEGIGGNDYLRGTAFSDSLEGKTGNDTVIGNGAWITCSAKRATT